MLAGGDHKSLYKDTPGPWTTVPAQTEVSEDVSAFSIVKNTPFPRTFGPKKTPFFKKCKVFDPGTYPYF